MAKPFNWQPYIELVEFIGSAFSSNAEVVLHDFTDVEHSVIDIKNGQVTGRGIGAPLTMFARRQLKEYEGTQDPMIMNYRGTAANGNELRSSSLFIRDTDGHVVGMLCINIDVSQLSMAAEVLQQLAFTATDRSKAFDEPAAQERFPASVSDMVEETLQEILKNGAVEIDRMLASEKQRIVEELHAKGLFQIKGAVGDAAAALHVSEATVYRYLSAINRRKQRPGAARAAAKS